MGASDLAALLGAWGACSGCAADINNDGRVNATDLSIRLGFWSATCAPPPWATVLEAAPNPAVVTDAALRNAIIATGLPWRVRDNASSPELNPQGPASSEYGRVLRGGSWYDPWFFVVSSTRYGVQPQDPLIISAFRAARNP